MNPRPSFLLLSLWLLTPALSWAGALTWTGTPTEPGVPSRSAFRVAAPQDAEVPGTQDTWHEERDRPAMGLRILSEVGVGLGGMLLGGIAGFGLGAAIPCKPTGGFLSCALEPFLGAAVGLYAGLPVGVWLGGLLAKGEGGFLATLAGSSVGFLVALILYPVAANAGAVGLVGVAVLPLVLSVTAYELTDARHQSTSSRRASRAPRLQPVLAATSGGGLIGLGGRF